MGALEWGKPLNALRAKGVEKEEEEEEEEDTAPEHKEMSATQQKG
jgi:hypothetical protein